MNSTETAARLIRGSRNIDRMRSEIDQVIRMTFGMVPFSSKDGIEATVESESCRWTFRVMKHSRAVECWKLTGFATLVYSSERQVPLYSNDVEFAYRNLHGFVEVALKAFPTLEEAWAPIISASEVQLAS